MPRTIKFRGWDESIKLMLDPVDLSSPFSKTTDWLGMKDVKLMQFIGLLDVNDKEIYEDDICRIKELKEFPDVYRVHQNLFKVSYMDDCERATFEFFSPPNLWGKLPNGSERKTDENIETFIPCNGEEYFIEVIGNIYENPELLSKDE